jgi:predicted RND superfamily exporter protein
MDNFFVRLYRFNQRHKALMYITLLVSAAIFIYFGLKVRYEEDISKLLPSDDSTSDAQLAFGSLKVKDKIFLQFQGADTIDFEALTAACDEFFDTLAVRDSSTRYIDNVLYKIDDDVLVLGLDYALAHVPSFVDTSCYRRFDASMQPDSALAQMQENLDLLENDFTGSYAQMVSTDPLGLRKDLGVTLSGGVSGYTLIDNHIFCKDSTVELGFVSPDFSSFDSRTGTYLVRMLENEISDFQASHPGIKVLMHGAPVRSANNSRRIKLDLLLTIGISLIVILIFLCIAFKSLSVILFMILPIAYGTFFALACIYWIKGGMSIMALGIGAIVLGVALSYCLHVLTHYKYVKDAEKMLRDEAKPVCLGCLTTIGAFMGLLFTKSDLLRDFGIFSTLALIGSTLFALIVLPHLMTLRSHYRAEKRNEKIFAGIDRMDSYPLDQKKWINWTIAAIIVICIVFSFRVQFDSNLKNIGYNPPELLESEALFAEKNYGGNAQVYYASTGSTLDEALEANRQVVSIIDQWKRKGVVRQSSDAVGLLFQTTDQQNERIAAWKAYWTPEKISQARSAINRSAEAVGLNPDSFELFYEMVGNDYEPGSLYDSDVLPEGLMCNLIEKSDECKFLAFTSVQVSSEDKRKVSDAVASVPGLLVVDPFYYTTDMVEVIHDDYNVVLMVSSLFVLLVLLLSFRNIWVALLAFMPMFLSWFVVEGIMAIFGMKFNLINIVISTFIFGIGVDYSIFYMEGLLDEVRAGNDKLLIYHKAAIFFSAFVLLVVTVALIFARHPALSSTGISTFIGMASTILITYTLQPFLFKKMLRNRYFRRSIGRSFRIDSLMESDEKGK